VTEKVPILSISGMVPASLAIFFPISSSKINQQLLQSFMQKSYGVDVADVYSRPREVYDISELPERPSIRIDNQGWVDDSER
jgi:hypothetical protein